MEYAPPAVPNPYTLLSQLPPESGWFTCLDLKDAFFCIRLALQSQSLLAFEWTEPDTGRQLQLTWTRLPQGFKNSPILFEEVLASDLATFPREEYRCTLLQYVDDLLLACATEIEWQTATWALLSHLAEMEYRHLNEQSRTSMAFKCTADSVSGLLLENPRILLETVHALNPATFLPTEEGDAEHDCIEVINEVYATRPNLRDSPHPNLDLTLYTDGSSFLRDGKGNTGYSITTTDEVAVIHCRGHQRGNEPSAVGNRLADTTAKSVATGSLSELLLVTDTTTTSLLRYTKEKLR
ncbi:hypothetical protein mRhiFer1_007964 [Rhinolophus ferrumequinum]|uniref:Reverse transcriptase domain-containing protein n=1 Tax=Rhinolophus ferrumequinum TaxID=59479 RepID=A0A7J8AVG8_RHIFE|nr:hypothetical protein mRhiFer1_007964 [Rhinolophus ferrumequinum]